MKSSAFEPKETHIWRLRCEADDGVEVAWVGELKDVARRGFNWRGGMRVVEADDLEPARARVSQRLEVVGRIDQEACCRCLGDVSSRHSLDDLLAAAEQKTAALVRRGGVRVRDNRTSYFGLRTYRLSMAMAMPMPPPMHSDATP